MPTGFAVSDDGFFQRRRLRFCIRLKLSGLRRAIQVVSHHECAEEIQRAANRAQTEHRHNLHDGFEEVWVLQEAVVIELFPHQSFGDTRDVNRDAIKHHPEQPDPEMIIRHFRGPQLRFVKARK